MHDASLLDEYAQKIGEKTPGTIDLYQRILRGLIALRPHSPAPIRR
jgi:hypothetical protein